MAIPITRLFNFLYDLETDPDVREAFKSGDPERRNALYDEYELGDYQRHVFDNYMNNLSDVAGLCVVELHAMLGQGQC